MDLLDEFDEINKSLEKQKDESEIKRLTKKLEKVNMKLDEIGAHDAENKAKFILLGLGFKEEDFTKKTKDFFRRMASKNIFSEGFVHYARFTFIR